jgi:hypothetical protein
MPRPAALLALVLACGPVLAGCGGSASAVADVTGTSVPAATTSSGAAAVPTASGSGAAPTVAQWCASYASITTVLAQTSSDAASATSTLAALERFDLLWGIADNLGIIAPADVAANQRAVASYRSVMTLVAAGKSRTSPEVVSATAALTTQTNADRTALSDSAGRVLALCGGPSATPST